jgi:chaperonin cofactor prefoldin
LSSKEAQLKQAEEEMKALAEAKASLQLQLTEMASVLENRELNLVEMRDYLSGKMHN